MKKLYLILFLSTTFIAPECCGMKRCQIFLKKYAQAKNYNNNSGAKSDGGIENWNNIVKKALVLTGCAAYAAINTHESFDAGAKKGSIGYFEADGKKIEFTGSTIQSCLMTLFAEWIIAQKGGPLLVYSAFQVASYSAGYYNRK